MHRLAATPGGWTPDTDGVILIEQTPASLIILTAADTEIQCLAQAAEQLPADFPTLRVTNLLQLQQQLTIDIYAEAVLAKAQVIVLRLLGGRSYWSYGLEVVQELAEQTGAAVIVLPGDDRPDPDLISHSTIPLAVAHRIWQYFNAGGGFNLAQGLQVIANACLGQNYCPSPPRVIPSTGLYIGYTHEFSSPAAQCPKVGILFYRAHYLAGNTAPIDALCQALVARNLEPVPVFVTSLREPEVQAEVQAWFQPKDAPGIEVLLNATSFAIARLDPATPTIVELWEILNVPVLQVIFSSSTAEHWRSQFQGLLPRDIAMNIALPEVDGRIISRAVSFKAIQTWNSRLETDVISYEPVPDRIEFVADLAAHWIKLRQTPVTERRVALILANYPTRDGRLANGVGLDTPASCVVILKALQQAGYTLSEIPQTSDELMQRLTAGMTNDPEGQELRQAQQSLSLEVYLDYFASLPEPVQTSLRARWGDPSQLFRRLEMSHKYLETRFPIPGIQLANVFIGIQPARGYDQDPALNYHAPDLEPTHQYLAFYYWLREHFGAQAIVHVGKHGNLEWLPGKSVALSADCYPEVALGPLPHLYPFIVNDPGEGTQAKRRAQAVILDHLTPPMTRAELYGPLQRLEHLIDEYYEAQNLDPTRLPIIRDRIQTLVNREHLQQELLLHSGLGNTEFGEFLSRADGYLCELKEAQIRDGLHVLGQCPQGQQLRDLIVAIARCPSQGRPGLTQAIAQDWNLNLDPVTADLGQSLHGLPQNWAVAGDAVAALEEQAAVWVEQLIEGVPYNPPPGSASQAVLDWIARSLLPALTQTSDEITHLLRGLEGGYLPSGPAGAPTRGRSDVLPTGRNFYSVDLRSLPTETAWAIGRKAAEALIERYTQEQGEYPKTLGLSIWGTSTMRTGGDDVAQALALLGVQPVWDGPSRRVVDFEILPLTALGRPRVDVTLRISGFFRDAFANLIDLFDQAVQAVAALDEPAHQNPLAAQIQQETQLWQSAGLSTSQAQARASYRIFGSKPGAYGAGLQGLIEAQNWLTDRDLAQAYLNWSCYAYSSVHPAESGRSAPEAFEQRLKQLQIVLHNQDNREHDLLDSDDYYQFQGGMTAAVRVLQGRNPEVYFGDHSQPANPRIRRLQEEIARVYRSRVVNPKWIAGVMRHGYKGAFEMAATVDYMFAYDVTAHCVEDYQYQGIAEAYLLDATVQAFIQQHNPWALRDMAERLLEAHQRGFWQNIDSETIEQLRAIAHQAEAVIETQTTSAQR